MTAAPKCPKCGEAAKPAHGRDVYKNRPSLAHMRLWVCFVCDTRCSRGASGLPAGRMADRRSRRLKVEAHAAFDPLWQSGRMSRSAAYAWLRNALGLSDRQCHMAWMSDEHLRLTIEVSKAKRAKENPA